MKKKADKTDNELIAEFMGRDWKSELKWIEDEDSKKPRQIEVALDPEDLLYDKSYDSIMEVVKKIRDSPELYGKESKRKLFVTDIMYALTVCDLSRLYESVVKYVKWYSLNNTKV